MLVVNKNPSKATNLSNTPAMPLATNKKGMVFCIYPAKETEVNTS